MTAPTPEVSDGLCAVIWRVKWILSPIVTTTTTIKIVSSHKRVHLMQERHNKSISSYQGLNILLNNLPTCDYLGGAWVMSGGPFCMSPWPPWLYWLYGWGAETGGAPEAGGPLAGPETQEQKITHKYTNTRSSPRQIIPNPFWNQSF